MHYIRFLKNPKIEVKKKSCIVKALITVATDLGDDFLSVNLKIYGLLVRGSEILAMQDTQWESGMRALQLELPPVVVALLKAPSTLVVSPFHDLDKALVRLSLEHLPHIIPVWSEPFTLDDNGGYGGCQRKVISTSNAVVAIHEDPGDSIARHLW